MHFRDIESTSRPPSDKRHLHHHLHQQSACSYNVSSNGENSAHKFDEEMLMNEELDLESS